MELRRSLNTAHREGHELAQVPVVVARSPRSRRLPVPLRRLALCVVAIWLIVFAAGPVASAQATTMTKPEKKLMTLVNHMRAKLTPDYPVGCKRPSDSIVPKEPQPWQ